jgi:GTPase
MSFRLDEGHGSCMYRVGVEDDGCHSLLAYATVAESCRVLEYLARSLNAVVVERLMIQNEVAANERGEACKLEGGEDGVVRIREPAVLGNSMGLIAALSEEDAQRIHKTNSYTRAELTIQRIETHLLDPSPITLSELVESSHGTGAATKDTGLHGATAQQALSTTTSDDGTVKKTTVGETMSARNIRVAVVGNVDAGKSTLIGVSAS